MSHKREKLTLSKLNNFYSTTDTIKKHKYKPKADKMF